MKDPAELIHSIEKRMKTTMIGAIAKFEDRFSYLWEEDNVNKERYEDLWDNTRNDILNHGNHQIRSAIKELSDFVYGPQKEFNQKYHYKFYFKNPDSNNGDSYEN
jgi:hypothetical protein